MLNDATERVIVVLGDEETWDVDGSVMVFNHSLIAEHYPDIPIPDGCDGICACDVITEEGLDELVDTERGWECMTESITILELLEFYRTAKKMGLERIIKDVQ
jgi:hypothetical protein|tara:strand:+ start:343 stop:651 length:309 start_codon:yes stop_codon:yes gene_type:complete